MNPTDTDGSVDLFTGSADGNIVKEVLALIGRSAETGGNGHKLSTGDGGIRGKDAVVATVQDAHSKQGGHSLVVPGVGLTVRKDDLSGLKLLVDLQSQQTSKGHSNLGTSDIGLGLSGAVRHAVDVRQMALTLQAANDAETGVQLPLGVQGDVPGQLEYLHWCGLQLIVEIPVFKEITRFHGNIVFGGSLGVSGSGELFELVAAVAFEGNVILSRSPSSATATGALSLPVSVQGGVSQDLHNAGARDMDADSDFGVPARKLQLLRVGKMTVKVLGRPERRPW